MAFLFSRFSRSWGALGARAAASLSVSVSFSFLALLLPLASSGCTKVACFEWTEAEGVCPAQDEALIFFADPFCGAGASEIQTIESDGEFDDNACCYEVTKRGDDDVFFCDSTGVTVGVGGTGGVSTGGVAGGSVGGAGGAGGGMGGAGGAQPPCIRCSDALSGGDPTLLCSGSTELYTDYMMCTCVDVCSMVCSDSCAGQPKSEECITCESDTVNGCGNQLSACANDF